MDTKLPYKQRMHKVEINKKEGNELVKDQNWSQGVARYQNALQHCSKFYDLSPEQMEDLKAAKLSLYNNVSTQGIRLLIVAVRVLPDRWLAHDRSRCARTRWRTGR